MIRALIVDDEPLALEGLRTRLSLERDITVVAEAGDGPAALEAIRTHAPDLLFLDIQMPGMDGFEVLRALEGEAVPVVVFVTAFDRHALRAFEAHALDYLLKPYTASRFADMLRKARRELERMDLMDRQSRIRKLLKDEEPTLSTETESVASKAPRDGLPTRMAVRDGERYLILDTREIDRVESAGNYVRVHARGSVFQVRSTLCGIADQLDSRRFVRIHRSTIVNADRVAEVRPEWHGDFEVILKSGEVLRMSRTFRRNLIP